MSREAMILLLATVFSITVTLPVLAAAPAVGIVIEGHSVPGVVALNVNAVVRVKDDRTLSVSGARVEATWTLPNGSSQTVSAISDYGAAYLAVKKGRRGIYTLTIDNVILEGHSFDLENSLLSASFVKSPGCLVCDSTDPDA